MVKDVEQVFPGVGMRGADLQGTEILSLVQINPWYLALVDIDTDRDIETLGQDTLGSQD